MHKNWIETSKKLSGLCLSLDRSQCFSRSGEEGETGFINPVRDSTTNAAIKVSILELLQLVSK